MNESETKSAIVLDSLKDCITSSKLNRGKPVPVSAMAAGVSDTKSLILVHGVRRLQGARLLSAHEEVSCQVITKK